jgi:hypothetical protein
MHPQPILTHQATVEAQQDSYTVMCEEKKGINAGMKAKKKDKKEKDKAR